MMPETLLDTDMLAMVMRKHPEAVIRAKIYLSEHHRFIFSIITQYEIMRSLIAKEAIIQLAMFHDLCAKSRVLPLTNEIIGRAAEIYADLHHGELLIGDVYILIAASALTHGLTVTTINKERFKGIPGLRVESWITS